MITFENQTLIIIGLGYVGLPLAEAFSKHMKTIGFDIDENRIKAYQSGRDLTTEIGDERLKQADIIFTSNLEEIKKADYIIVTVPTPINDENEPDLSPLLSATEMIGTKMKKGAIIIFESTISPGATEEICVPVLVKMSGFECGVDFSVGYSPERINPGDKINRLTNIVKIVSAQDEATTEKIAALYGLIIEAGIFKAASIKVAEAAKVIENTQRDVNIAFINDIAMAMTHLNIDTKEVLNAMNTKWNALGFSPGLVGGHCIGVDTYYLTTKLAKYDYMSPLIAASRAINENMSNFVTNTLIKNMILADIKIKSAKVAIFGITFKADCPDIRNSKVVDIVKQLQEYEIDPLIIDPLACKVEVKQSYDLKLAKSDVINDLDALIIAVDHEIFKQQLQPDVIENYFKKDIKQKVIIDIKSMLSQDDFMPPAYHYWRL